METNNKFESEGETVKLRKQTSEYAMALDLMSKLTQACTEQEAIESIIQVFETLFSPQKAFYVSLKNNQPEHVYSLSSLRENTELIRSRLSDFNKKFSLTETNSGFHVLIKYNDNKLGILEIDNLKFPENRDRYLNLTLSMVDVCGLAIENAKRYSRIKEAENNLLDEKEKLEEALSRVKTLTGLLPICMHCKKIRDEKGYWKRIEAYIQENSEAEFSHSICRECAKEHYPDMDIYDD